MESSVKPAAALIGDDHLAASMRELLLTNDPSSDTLFPALGDGLEVSMKRSKDAYARTKMCSHFQQGRCLAGLACRYAHYPEDLRIRPDLRKTRMCLLFAQGRCGASEKQCCFAHNRSELRATNDLYKTSLCKFWLSGTCKSGQFCRHAHGELELRGKAVASPIRDNLAEPKQHAADDELFLPNLQDQGRGDDMPTPALMDFPVYDLLQTDSQKALLQDLQLTIEKYLPLGGEQNSIPPEVWMKMTLLLLVQLKQKQGSTLVRQPLSKKVLWLLEMVLPKAMPALDRPFAESAPKGSSWQSAEAALRDLLHQICKLRGEAGADREAAALEAPASTFSDGMAFTFPRPFSEGAITGDHLTETLLQNLSILPSTKEVRPDPLISDMLEKLKSTEANGRLERDMSLLEKSLP